MTDSVLLFENNPIYKIPESPLACFGSAPSQFLIILEQHSTYFFSSPHYYFLNQILKALNLNYSKIGLIEAHDQLDLELTVKKFSPQKLVLFGNHNLLNQAAHYEVSIYHSLPYLFGPHLESLYNNPLQKKRFWQTLKKFGKS